MDRLSSRRRLGHAAAWLVLCGIAYRLTPDVFALDDAYIALHSARVLVTGSDPIYNTPALVGVTCPPYVALLAVLVALHLPALQVATALGAVAFVAALWALGGTLKLSWPRTVSLIVVTFASGYTVINLSNGIETGWAIAVLTWLIVFALQDRPLLAGGAAGLLPMLRPDLAPASILVIAYVLWHRPWPERWRVLGVAAAVSLPWIVWVRIDTGTWLPRTMEAKRLWFAEFCWPSATKRAAVLGALEQIANHLFPVSLGVALMLFRRVGRIGAVAIAASIAAYAFVFPGGLHHNFFRYPYAIILPWACLGLATALSWERDSRRLTLLYCALAAVAVYKSPIGALDGSPAVREMLETSQWIDAHVAPDQIVLVHDAGAPSEFAHRRLVDVVGLKTPSSIDAAARWTGPACGAGRPAAIAEIARNSRASYLVAIAGWNHSYALSDSLEKNGFIVRRVRMPGNIAGYTVYSLEDTRANTASR